MHGISHSPPLNIALLDDHDVVRHGTCVHLSTDPRFRIVGSHGHSRDLLATLATCPVDVAIVDYALADTDIDGLALVRQLCLDHPRVPILVFSAHLNKVVMNSALSAGAAGLVTKNERIGELARAIVLLAEGAQYLPAEYAPEREGAALSPSERSVLRLCLEGMTVSEIALRRHRSIKTVSTQKHAAFRKLGLRSDGDLYTHRHQLEDL